MPMTQSSNQGVPTAICSRTAHTGGTLSRRWMPLAKGFEATKSASPTTQAAACNPQRCPRTPGPSPETGRRGRNGPLTTARCSTERGSVRRTVYASTQAPWTQRPAFRLAVPWAANETLQRQTGHCPRHARMMAARCEGGSAACEQHERCAVEEVAHDDHDGKGARGRCRHVGKSERHRTALSGLVSSICEARDRTLPTDDNGLRLRLSVVRASMWVHAWSRLICIPAVNNGSRSARCSPERTTPAVED